MSWKTNARQNPTSVQLALSVSAFYPATAAAGLFVERQDCCGFVEANYICCM